MRRVKKAKAFGNAFAQIFAVNLERHVAADIDGPKVCGRNTIADPVRHDLAHATSRLQADGIEASGDKAAFQFSAFTQMVSHVRGEAFGTAEEFLNTRFFQCRHTAHRINQQWLKMFEASGNFIETEIFRYAVHTPRPRIGFKCADKQLARVIFIITTIIIIAQNRQGIVDAFDAFE